MYKHIACKQSINRDYSKCTTSPQKLCKHIFFILQTIGCAVVTTRMFLLYPHQINTACTFSKHHWSKINSAKLQSFVNQITPKDVNNAISYFLVLLLFVHCTHCVFSFHPCCQSMSIKPSVPLLWQIQRFIYNIYVTTFCHGKHYNLSGILIYFGMNLSASTALTTNTTSTTIVQNIRDHCSLTTVSYTALSNTTLSPTLPCAKKRNTISS